MIAALLDDLIALLEAGTPVASLVILDRSGSTPRAAGARMLVLPDGSIRGTVGGGLLEAQAVQAGRETLADGQPRRLDLTFSGHDAASAGMICGGRASLLAQRLEPGALAFFEQVRAALGQAEPAWLVTGLASDAAGGAISASMGLLQNGRLAAGEVSAAPDWLAQQAASAGGHVLFTEQASGGWLVEALRRREVVFIFGAGHVSRELARVAAFAGFEVVVLDERDEFADARFFPDAGQVLVVPGFARAFDFIDVTPESYLVIVTRGHLDDQVVLEGALRTDAAYIGMIGSRRKRALIDQTLLQKGFSAADIARVCSPVGLPIGAETPEEIAISITAQLIAARAAQRGE